MTLKNKWLIDYAKEHSFKTFKSYEPCYHKGCIHHIVTPCELCGRFGAQGEVKINLYELEKIINRLNKLNKLNKIINEKDRTSCT